MKNKRTFKKYTQKSKFKKNYTYFSQVCSLILHNEFIFSKDHETLIEPFKEIFLRKWTLLISVLLMITLPYQISWNMVLFYRLSHFNFISNKLFFRKYSTMKSIILFILFLIINCLDHHQAESRFEPRNSNREKWLGKDFLIKWETNDTKQSIKFSIEVKTKGWIGFGFSKHGIKTEVDMVIGWVDDRGVSSFYVSGYQ